MAGSPALAALHPRQPHSVSDTDPLLAGAGVVAPDDPAGGDGRPASVPGTGDLRGVRPSTVGQRATRPRAEGSCDGVPAKRSRASAMPLSEREALFKQMLTDTMDTSLTKKE